MLKLHYQQENYVHLPFWSFLKSTVWVIVDSLPAETAAVHNV